MSILTSDIADQLIAEQGFDIIIPGHFTAIEDEVFFERKLKSVDIPESIVSIGDYAFSDKRLTSVIYLTAMKRLGRTHFRITN